MNKKLFLFLGALAVGAFGWAIGTYPYYHHQWFGTNSYRNTHAFTIQTPSEGAAPIFAPGTTNLNALGSTSLRFSNVLSVLGNFSGPITATAGLGIVVSTAPRTAVGVAALYSSFTIPAGTQFYNSTSGVTCISSGTVQTSITVSTGTGACPS